MLDNLIFITIESALEAKKNQSSLPRKVKHCWHLLYRFYTQAICSYCKPRQTNKPEQWLLECVAMYTLTLHAKDGKQQYTCNY